MRDVLKRTPYRDPRVTRAAVEERHARAAMDLALSIGEVLLRCGAGASQAEASVVAVAMAAGFEDLDIDITMQAILMQGTTPSGQLLTRLRVVRSPRWDFGRLALVHSLVADLVCGEVTLVEATTRMDDIVRSPRAWSRWVVTSATGLLAAGVAVMLGAGGQAVVLCAITSVAVEWIVERLGRNALPDFYLSVVGGFTATTLAWTGYVLGFLNILSVTPADFAAIVAGGIVAFLPARSIASAMEDVITGYPVTGTSRISAVLFHTLGLIIGVATALAAVVEVAELFDLRVSAPAVERMASARAPFAVALIGAFAIGLTGAITMQAKRRFLLPSAALCVVGVAISTSVARDTGVGRVVAVGITAIALGFLARVVALRMGAPAMVLAVPASLGLLPGLAIFVGLYRLVVQSGSDLSSELTVQVGVQTLATALGVLVAIATGTTLGDILAAPLDKGAWRRRRRAEAGPPDEMG